MTDVTVQRPDNMEAILSELRNQMQGIQTALQQQQQPDMAQTIVATLLENELKGPVGDLRNMERQAVEKVLD